ncbi:hypothetical protein LCGC14_3029600 [marine sediment metagenome]|uniref:Uncharacterized protein n=1 Tax=marine sediment metagenome TaxID=412755 RepID=A0A0F8XG30_9ZZZZ
MDKKEERWCLIQQINVRLADAGSPTITGLSMRTKKALEEAQELLCDLAELDVEAPKSVTFGEFEIFASDKAGMFVYSPGKAVQPVGREKIQELHDLCLWVLKRGGCRGS